MRYSIYEGVKRFKTKTTALISSIVLGLGGVGAGLLIPLTAHAVTCTSVSTSKGALTAAQVGGNVTTPLDATGCHIGVYYDSANTGDVSSEIFGATYYGVFVDGRVGDVNVNATNSHIHNIGETPFNGAQHGLAIYYYGYQTTGNVTGVVDGNTVDNYQKGGITVNGENATVDVTDNTVTGFGPVGFIAQNGIQIGFGATAPEFEGNNVSGNIYTQNGSCAPGCVGSAVGVVSTGVLFYLATDAPKTGTVAKNNHVYKNQANITIIN